MSWKPYRGDDYWDADTVAGWVQETALAHPGWCRLDVVGTSREGRDLQVLTVSESSGDVGGRPAFWVDGGTHAAEWTGVMATVFAVSRWLEALQAGHAETVDWFAHNAVYVLPCISPDGMQALHHGTPFLRSTLRPPREGEARSGFEPRDLDGDGSVRLMRWKDPAGPFVPDEEQSGIMRPRTLLDDPANAYFVSQEGDFLDWDGLRWTATSRRFGLDLNRNFPDMWKPFSMFGMDSGDYPMSEPEARAVVEAFAARPNIACALTNHTYTGCLLTAPARADDVLGQGDIRMMELLATDAVEGTGYRVIKKHPHFTYDEKNPVVGCWDDALCNTFGVAGYTLELWDPFAYAGVENPEPAKFFQKPDIVKVRKMAAKFAEDPDQCLPWTSFEHPQLGSVEIGGFSYYTTFRNPPLPELAAEMERGFTVADRLRRALPDVHAHVSVDALDGASRVRLVLENRGFLPTAGLLHGETLRPTLPVSATLETGAGCRRVVGTRRQGLSHLDGWGVWRTGLAANPIYPSLPDRGHRAVAEWVVQGAGEVQISYQAGRAGRGRITVKL